MIDPSNFNGVVLELFSGIGGMRAGLERVADTGAITLRDVTAVDINHFANSMYSHNFHSPDGKVKGRVVTKLIEQFSPEWLDKLGADLWVPTFPLARPSPHFPLPCRLLSFT
jgi:site-specific DNA-cytosine methylase